MTWFYKIMSWKKRHDVAFETISALACEHPSRREVIYRLENKLDGSIHRWRKNWDCESGWMRIQGGEMDRWAVYRIKDFSHLKYLISFLAALLRTISINIRLSLFLSANFCSRTESFAHLSTHNKTWRLPLFWLLRLALLVPTPRPRRVWLLVVLWWSVSWSDFELSFPL